MSRMRMLGVALWMAVVLASPGFILPQRDFDVASGADRAAAVYGVARSAEFLATADPADKVPWTGRNSACPCGALAGAITEPMNSPRVSALHVGQCSDGPHSPSILTLQRHLRI